MRLRAAALVATLLAALPAAAAPRPELRLDPRVELAAALQLLAGPDGAALPGFRDDGSEYARVLSSGTAAGRGHPAVAAYVRTARRVGTDGQGFMTALHELHRCLDDRLALRAERPDCRRSAFAHAAADFAAATRFAALIPALDKAAEPSLAPLRARRDADDWETAYERYARLPAGDQRIAPSPLLQTGLAWNDLDRPDAGPYQILTVASPGPHGTFAWGPFLRDVGHEHSHALLDEAADAADAKAGPAPNVEACYGSWRQCVREHVAQGVSLRLVQLRRQAGDPDAPDAALNSRLPWQADVADLLRDRYETRKTGTLRDFAPRIAALLREKAAALPPAPAASTATAAAVEAARAASERGMALYAQGRSTDAAAAFEAAVAAGGGAEALLNLAAARRAQGRPADAAAALDRAVLRARADATLGAELLPDALSSRADLREALGDRAGARADLEEALAAAPLDWPRRAEAETRRAALAR